MAVCPKCGFDLAENQSECPRCGVILAKARPAPPRPVITEVPVVPEIPATPSPPPQVQPVMELRGDATKLRILAASIDNVFATLAGFLIGAFYGRMLGPFQPAEIPITWSELPLDPSATGWLFVGMGYLAYFFVLESVWGTTLGKGLLGLRVARLDGKPVGLSEAWWRTLTRIFELNPLLLGAIPGGLTIVKSKRRQRLGDMIAGTVVVSRALALAFAAGQAHRQEGLGGIGGGESRRIT
jgi:uncharacterized RDD family membrane protein YckC